MLIINAYYQCGDYIVFLSESSNQNSLYTTLKCDEDPCFSTDYEYTWTHNRYRPILPILCSEIEEKKCLNKQCELCYYFSPKIECSKVNQPVLFGKCGLRDTKELFVECPFFKNKKDHDIKIEYVNDEENFNRFTDSCKGLIKDVGVFDSFIYNMNKMTMPKNKDVLTPREIAYILDNTPNDSIIYLTSKYTIKFLFNKMNVEGEDYYIYKISRKDLTLDQYYFLYYKGLERFMICSESLWGLFWPEYSNGELVGNTNILKQFY